MANELLKSAIRAVFNVIAEKQYREMEKNRPLYDAMLSDIPSGKEKQEYTVGQNVISTGTGTYKAGLSMEVLEAYEENGYFKYICGHGPKDKKTGKYKFSGVERQKDLKKG